jgi:hypothetical protein
MARCLCNRVTSLVPAFFEDIYDNPDQINRLQYLFAAFRDSNRLLVCAQPNVKDRYLSYPPPPHSASFACLIYSTHRYHYDVAMMTMML